jgi:hypothetical protein
VTDVQKALAILAGLNSALFLTGAYVAGMVTGNPLAWKMALASCGLAFIGYVAQYLSGVRQAYWYVAGIATAASIVAGVISGGALLWVR